MLSVQQVRDNPERIREAGRLKGEPAPVDEILELDEQARALRTQAETLRAEQNRVSRSFRGTPGGPERQRLAELKERIQALLDDVGELEHRRDELLLELPNPPHESVPVGTSEADNLG